MKFNMTEDTWTVFSTTPERRSSVAFDFDPRFGLIMVGGFEKGTHVSSGYGDKTNYVHISRDFGQTFEELAHLPFWDNRRYIDSNGDVFFIDEKTVFYKPNTFPTIPFYILDLESNTWSEGLPLKYPRSGMHVGLITRSSGEKEIVFIGGQANGSGRETWAPADAKDCHSRCNNWYTKTVEIYNIASKTLRMGPDTPKFMGYGMTTQYMDSFLVSSAKDGDDCCSLNNNFKGIWRYNDDDTFTLMPGQHPTTPYIKNGGWWVDDLC